MKTTFLCFLLSVLPIGARQLSYIDRANFFHQLDDTSSDSTWYAFYVSSSVTQTAFFNGQSVGLNGAATLVLYYEDDMGRLISYFYRMAASALWWGEYYSVTLSERSYWNGVAAGYYAAAHLGEIFLWDARTLPGSVESRADQ